MRFCLPVCMCTMFVQCPGKSKEGMSCHRIQLQIVVSCHVAAGKQTRVLWKKAQPVLRPSAPTHSPPHFHLLLHLRQQKNLFVVHLSHSTVVEDMSSPDCHRSGAVAEQIVSVVSKAAPDCCSFPYNGDIGAHPPVLKPTDFLNCFQPPRGPVYLTGSSAMPCFHSLQPA